MKRILDNPFLVLVARIVLGFIFISFGIEKIFDPKNFVSEILNYQIMPVFSVNVMALILPWLELIAGIMLIFGIRLKANALISGGLMFIFIVAIAIAMIKGLDINCGCSSSHPQKVGLPKLLENAGMFFLAAWIYYFPNAKLGLESFVSK